MERGWPCSPRRVKSGSPRSRRSVLQPARAPSSCSSCSNATLDQLDLAPQERAKREALQKQIIAAVQSEKGLASLPPEVRKSADTPWFQSVLNFAPPRVLKDVRQPLLIVHAGLDHEVPVADAERLADDRAEGEATPSRSKLLIVKGVNHLLVPAVTGE